MKNRLLSVLVRSFPDAFCNNIFRDPVNTRFTRRRTTTVHRRLYRRFILSLASRRVARRDLSAKLKIRIRGGPIETLLYSRSVYDYFSTRCAEMSEPRESPARLDFPVFPTGFQKYYAADFIYQFQVGRASNKLFYC